MNKFDKIADKSIKNGRISDADIRHILESDVDDLFPLLDSTYKVRHRYCGNKVRIHILNNVQSGGCTEDCRYCAQSGRSPAKKSVYPMRSESEIVRAAEKAEKAGAYRYCMVFSGRDLGSKRIEHICSIAARLKKRFGMELCVSAGFINEVEAERLKAAGVDRYNHNINTSRMNYPRICSSHEFQQRVNTIKNARSAGLDICSGVIIGMGESFKDLLNIVLELRKVKVDSIPVNFFIPSEGHRIKKAQKLTPEYCLKILCMFRLAFPRAEIRIAAGREYHLKSMQALSLCAVNSLFANGYLTIGGESAGQTKKMITDAGFEVESIEC